MKIFILTSLSLVVLASCKKDHTCSCNDGYEEYSYTIKDTKLGAKRTCENKVGVVSFNYENCHLTN